MLRRGTKTRSLQQINDQLDALKSTVSIGGEGQLVTARLVSRRATTSRAALDIVTDLLRAPAFDEDRVCKKLRDEVLAGIDQQRSDPQAISQLELERLLSPWPRGHFRHPDSFDEQVAAVKAVTVEDLRRFHEQFYGATAATAAVVGDFDEVTTRGALGAILAGWSAPQPFARAPDQYFDVPAVTRRIQTPDKANATLMAGVNLPLRDDDPDYPALVLANYMLGGGFLNSRLATRIRQKEGISYGVSSFLQADPLDKVGSFGAFAIYNPQNSARLLAAWREELERMLQQGFTEAELKDARAGWLQGRGVSRSQDRELESGVSVDDDRRFRRVARIGNHANSVFRHPERHLVALGELGVIDFPVADPHHRIGAGLEPHLPSRIAGDVQEAHADAILVDFRDGRVEARILSAIALDDFLASGGSSRKGFQQSGIPLDVETGRLGQLCVFGLHTRDACRDHEGEGNGETHARG